MPVSVPISIFDLTMQFVRPNLRLAMNRADFVEDLFEQFGRWDISVDDIEVVQEGKPSEQGIKFKIPKRQVTFFFGPSHAQLIWDDAKWEAASEIIEILTIGLEALTKHGKVEVRTYKAVVALHLQPLKVPFIELLKPFASQALIKIDPSPITAFATVLRWEGRRITIDGSAQIANAIYVRFERDFPGYLPIETISGEIRTDEESLYSIIGVEEVQL